MKGIYALYDTVTEELAGPLFIMPLTDTHAPAIRVFGDAAQNTEVRKHLEDLELRFYGRLITRVPAMTGAKDNTLYIESEHNPQIVITGKQWLTAQQTPNGDQLHLLTETEHN